MRLKYFSIFIIFFSVNFAYSQEENAIIKQFRDKMILNIKNVSELRNKILDNTTDSFLDYKILFDGGLKSIYNYNAKKIMHRQDKFEDINAPTPFLHKNYVNTMLINKNKVLPSELILINGAIYYSLGIKNDKSVKILIFKLENLVENNFPFALINSKGEILLSKDIKPEKLKNILPKIGSDKTEEGFYQKNNIFRFKFFPMHEVYYFLEEQS